MNNTNEIKKFLESIRETDIEEMEVSMQNSSIYFKKSEITKKVVEPKKIIEEKSSIVPIKSTMVGTFFNAPASDRPPFIVEGSNVSDTEKAKEQLCEMSLEEHYKVYEERGLKKKEIIKQIAKDRKVSKNEIYQYFINE